MSYIIDAEFIQLCKESLYLNDSFEIQHIPCLKTITSNQKNLLFYVQEICLLEVGKRDSNIICLKYNVSMSI